MALVSPRLLIDRLSPRAGTAIAAALLLLVALADAATSYEVRLAILYLLPVGIASWTTGAVTGLSVAILATLIWLLSFGSGHFYSHPAYYGLEAMEMLGGLAAFAWVTARLASALRQADERLYRVLEEMHPAVYVADAASDAIVYANPSMRRLFGSVTSQGAVEDRFERDAEADTDAAGGFSPRLIRDPAAGRWYQLQDGPIPWGSNPNVRLKVLTDVTAQKSAERMRERHLEVMHESARLATLAETASTLAHEINQPLMVIATYTDACQRLLHDPRPDLAEIAAVLGKCHAQAVRAASTLERLREFVRQRRPQPAACEAQALVAEAVALLQPAFEDAGLVLEETHDAPVLVLDVDRILVVQVLVNIGRNAIDAMRGLPRERRILGIAVGETATGEAEFAFSDRGPGIEPSATEQIFAPFYSTKPDGLGLGLAISRSIAEAHGGRLGVESNPSGGATFRLFLPARRPRQ